MKVREVAAAIETLAPLGYAYPWDKPGLSIGDPTAEVSHVLVALEVTRDAFEAAQRVGAELIVSHHPAIWAPLKALRTSDPHTRLCLDLAQAGIHCYSAHTNLDVAPGGLNTYLARKLALERTGPLMGVEHAAIYKLVCFVPETHLDAVRDAVADAGAGIIGEYTHCTFSAPGTGTFIPSAAAQPFAGERGVLNEEAECRFEVQVPKARLGVVLAALLAAHPYEEPAYDLYATENRDAAVGLGLTGYLPEPMTVQAAAEYVKKRLETPHVRVVGELGREVRRVGLLAGSGGGEIHNLPPDLDLYITGDVRYHEALSGWNRGLAIIDAGHDGLEKWVVPALADYLSAQIPDLKVTAFSEPEIFHCL